MRGLQHWNMKPLPPDEKDAGFRVSGLLRECNVVEGPGPKGRQPGCSARLHNDLGCPEVPSNATVLCWCTSEHVLHQRRTTSFTQEINPIAAEPLSALNI